MYIYIYIYICINMYTYVYIYIDAMSQAACIADATPPLKLGGGAFGDFS